MKKQVGEDHHVVVDDAIGEQASALAPDLLLVFSLKAQLTKIGIGNHPAELVITFPSVEHLMDVLPER